MNNIIDELLIEAEISLKSGDIPVGAIIVENGKIISKAHNTREKTKQISDHAEINAINKACKIKNTWHLSDCEIYVTLEPCPMCLEAIKQSQIKKIFYCAKQEKNINYKNIEIKQIDDCGKSSLLLKKFFKDKRK